MFRRGTRIAAIAALLALPAVAVAAEDWEAQGLKELPVETNLRLLTHEYMVSKTIPHCSYRFAFEFKPVPNASYYLWTVGTRVNGKDYVSAYPPLAPPESGPLTTWDDPNVTGLGLPVWTASPGHAFVFIWDRRGDTSGACPTDPTEGGTNKMIKASALVRSELVPKDPAPSDPQPTAPTTPAPADPGPAPAGTTPTAVPQQLELLPPPKNALGRLQALATKDGSAPEVLVTRGGKVFRADGSSTFEFGDIVKTGGKTIITFEYLIGGRVSITAGASVRVIGERQLELLDGTTELTPDTRQPLEIQTNGGIMGIRG